jgi:LssY-like putative type I secretion system component LssY
MKGLFGRRPAESGHGCLRRGRLSIGTLGVWLGASVLLVGCAAYHPRPADRPSFRARARTETKGPIRVSVAALGATESREHFGIDLEAHGIQPVWVEIENRSAATLYLLFSSVDPAYFSAREAAYQAHRAFHPTDNRRMDEFLESQAIYGEIPPGGTQSGFVFTNHDERSKFVTVQLYGERQTGTFRFVLDVPGIRTDSDTVDFATLYTADRIVDLHDEAELRRALAQLPTCTTRRDGTGSGDALNLVLIGTSNEIGGTLVATGWSVTEAMSLAAAWRTLKAFLLGHRYRYSPMSTLYVFGRHQEIGFQKARDSIHQRNHLRLWLTPLRYRGREVWLGAISRDIGVYLTPRAWNLTTHAIDPDLDEAREAVGEDLIISQAVRAVGYVGGIGKATADRPHRNLMNAPYWTDGKREVFLFDDQPTSLEEIDFFDWD